MKKLLITLGVAAGIGLFAAPVSAGDDEPTADFRVVCADGSAFIEVAVWNDYDIAFDIYISTDDTITFEDRVYLGLEGLQTFGPYANGTYFLQVDWDEEPLFQVPQAIDVDCPSIEIEFSCDTGAGSIAVTITDDDESEYQIFIDEEFLVETGVDGTETFTYGPYTEGEHDVAIDWSGSKDNPIFEDTITIDCTDDGSGAGLPDAGGNATLLALIAASMLVVGMGVLTFRRIA